MTDETLSGLSAAQKHIYQSAMEEPVNRAGLNMPEQKPANNQGLLGDMVDAAQHGFGKAVAGVAETAYQVFDVEGYRQASDAMGRWADSQVDQMSEQGRASFQKPFLEEDANGEMGATDWRAWSLQIPSLLGQVGPQLAAGGGLGALAAKGATSIIARSAAKEAVKRGVSTEMAKKIGVDAAARTMQARGAMIAGTGGQALADLGISTGMLANEARSEWDGMSIEERNASELYQETFWNIATTQYGIRDPQALTNDIAFKIEEQAKRQVGDAVASAVATDPALLTSNLVLGAVGGHYIDKLLRGVGTGSRLKNAGMQGAVGAVTEGAQGGVEQYAINNAMIENRVDSDRDPMDGVVTNAMTEGLLGGVVMGAAGGLTKGSPEPKSEPFNQDEYVQSQADAYAASSQSGQIKEQTEEQATEESGEDKEKPQYARGEYRGLDTDILIAERMGFDDEMVKLKAAKKNYELAQQFRDEGNLSAAQRFQERGNRIYQEVLDSSEEADAFEGQFPVLFDPANAFEEGDGSASNPNDMDAEPRKGETIDATRYLPPGSGAMEMGYGDPKPQAQARATSEQAFTQQQGQQPGAYIEPEPQAEPEAEPSPLALPVREDYQANPDAIDWIAPGKIRQPRQESNLSLDDGDGIDFKPVPPEAPDTSNIERMIAAQDAADVDARRDARLPENYKEPRLLRDDYRAHLQGMANQLTPGGGAMGAPLADGTRAPSENPEWFRTELSNEDKRKGGGVKGFQQAVEKALAGEPLYANERHALDAMLGYLSRERSQQVEYTKEQRNQRRIDRAKYAKLKQFIRGEITPEELGMGADITPPVSDANYSEPDIPFDDIEDQYFTIDGLDDIGKELAQDIHNALKVGVPESVITKVINDNIDNPVMLASELEDLTWQYIRGETYAEEEGAPANTESATTGGGMEGESTSDETLSSYSQNDLDRLNEQESSAKSEQEPDIESPESFVLAGSDRDVDQAEARGQGNLLDLPPEPEPEPQKAEVKPDNETPADAGVSRSESSKNSPDVVMRHGDVFVMKSGRKTTPFPKFDASTHRKAINSLGREGRWKLDNALSEAKLNGDSYNEQLFESSLKNKRASAADLDLADAYLWGGGQPVRAETSNANSIDSNTKPEHPPIRNSKGNPFKTRGAAKGQLRKNPGYGVVEVDGGFELQYGVDSTIDTVPRTKPNEVVDEFGPDLNDIDAAANEAATSPSNDKPQPTDAQIEAGNYEKGHVTIHGMDVAIENPRSSNRSGTDPDGNQWSVEMKHHYGYIKKTTGADGEHIDVFIGKNPESEKVFVIDQVNADGSFDEHKVMVGFSDRGQAITGYKSNYEKGWKVGPVTEMSVDEFKQWLEGGDTGRPVSNSLKDPENVASAESLDLKKSEQKPVSDAFDNLFKTVETQEKDGPTILHRLKKLSLDAEGNASGDSKTTASKPLTEAASLLVELVNNWVEPLEASLGTKVNVVASTKELPSALRSQVGSDTEALLDRSSGEVYLIAENLDTEAKAVRAMLHEVVGHKGVINALSDAQKSGGKPVTDVLDDIYKSLGRVAIDRKIGRYGFDYKKASDRHEAVLEYIAHIAETGQRPNLVRRAVAAIKAALRRIFPQVGWTETDVLALIEKGRGHLVGETDSLLREKGFSSIVKGREKPKRGLTVEQAEALVDEFFSEFNKHGNIPLTARVKATQEELYGPEATIERVGIIQGAYHPASRVFTLAAENLSSDVSGRATIRHEILGHYGLNTFSGEPKKAFLQEVAKTRSEPAVSDVWGFVDRNYPKASELTKAEEVFSYIAETTTPNSGFRAVKDRILTVLAKLMRRSGIIKSSMTIDEIGREARVIADGIRSGRLKQKNFPARDDDQFMRRPLARLSDALDADTTLTDAQREALGKIGPETIQESVASRVRSAWENAALKLRQGMVDRFAGLLEMDKQLLDGEVTTEENITRSAWVKARMANAASGAVSALMNAGRVYLDKDGVIDVKKDTQGLVFSLHKLGSAAEVEKFMGWIAGNRAAKLKEQGRENLFSDKDIEALKTLNEGILSDGRDRNTVYEQVFKEFQQHRDDVLTIADKAGLLGKALSDDDALLAMASDSGLGKGLAARVKAARREAVKAEDMNDVEDAGQKEAKALQELEELLKENLDDFDRQFDFLTTDQKELWMNEFYVPFYRVMEEQDKANGPRKTTGLSRQEAYKQLKGGSQKLQDLLQNTIMNFHHLLDASMKNMAAQQVMDNAEQLGIAEPVSATKAAKDASTYVLQNGRKQWYNIDDPFVYQSLMSLSHTGMNGTAMKVMRAFKRTFTSLTTSTPQFVVANLIRDSLAAPSTADISFNPVKNVGAGIKNFGVFDRGGYERARLLASGGAFSFGHVYGEHADEIKASINGELSRAQVLKDPKGMWGLLKSGWQRWQDIQNSAENANRMSAFMQAEKAGKGKLYAAFQARDIMDFSGMGAYPAMRFLIDTVPFLNARIQGLDKLYRSGVKPTAKVVWNMLGRGEVTGNEKQAAARFMTVVGALSLASMALYLNNKDDEEFKKAPDWMRDTYWWIRSGDDVYLIPKPFEVGAISTLTERLLEQVVDDKATGELFAERLFHMLFQTFSFSPIPQVMQPALDVYANRDSFTGRDIETMGMERLSPSNRVRSDTTYIAKWAGDASEAVLGSDSGFTLSPVQIDYLIAGYLGQVGAWGFASADVLVNTVTGHERPASNWYEYQPVRRFYRNLNNPSSGKHEELFYEALRESSRLYADLRQYQEIGDAVAAEELREDNRDLLAIRKRLNKAQRQLSSVNRQIRQIERSDAMSGEEKRRRIDLLKMRRSQIVERVTPLIEKARSSS